MRPSQSLQAQLALSHLLVLLLAVGVTVAANYFLFRKGFDARMLAETQQRAKEMANLWESSGRPDNRLAQLELIAAQEGQTPVKFSLVPLGTRYRGAPSFFSFPFSPEQLELLSQGLTVSGAFNEGDGSADLGHFCAYPVGLDGPSPSAVVAYGVKMKAALGRPIAYWILQSLALALLPAALLAARLARHLVDPILVLQAATARVAHGDYTARSGLRRRDELGAVSRDFDAMAQKLEADLEIRSRLLGDISHELGTPVTTLRATAEALLDGLISQPEDLRMCHQSMLRQVEHLSYLVRDVTELARYEMGEISLTHRNFSAAEPLEQAVEAAQMAAYQRGSTIETETGPGAALGDSRRIHQVLKNLVHNAIDHNPSGTTVWVSCRAQDEEIVYSVEDSGPRIPDRDKDAIFERFTKLDLSRPRGLSGGGLGLSIVREILTAHRSGITLSDTPRGKVFSFRLRSLPAECSGEASRMSGNDSGGSESDRPS